MNYSTDNNNKKIKNNNSNSKKVKTKTSVIVFRVIIAVIIIVGFAIGGALIGAYIGIVEDAPELNTMIIEPSVYTTIIYSDQTGEELSQLDGKENRVYATLDMIPIDLQEAFIAIEDERFYSHNGVDIKGSIRSVVSTVTGNRQGGSTITQQLIKNSRGLQRNTIVTKLQEQYLAVKYEKDLTKKLGSKKAAKDYILELYLNTIALGHNLNGVQTASQYYFEKDVSEVTLSESAVIAAITQRPTAHAPDDYPENNVIRARQVINNMSDQGYITQQEYNDAMTDLDGPVYDRIKESKKVIEEKASSNSYFTDQIITELVKDFMEMGNTEQQSYNLIFNGGLQIFSTEDAQMKSIVDNAMLDDSLFSSADYKIEVNYLLSVKNSVTDEVNHYKKTTMVKSQDEIPAFVENAKAELMTENDDIIGEKTEAIPQPQASFIIIENGTGKVLAMSGGRGEKTEDRVLNRATQSYRQPGSVFKILAGFAPGIDLGTMNSSTVFDDVPFADPVTGREFSNWYTDGYRGLSTVREGVRDSMNIIAVKAMNATGSNATMEYLLNFGFTSIITDTTEPKNDTGLATALGGITNGVSNLETTAAFATIENGGTYIEPIFYTKVLNHDGEVLIDKVAEQERRQVMREQSAYIVTDMMKDVVTSGTGTAARLSNMTVAGKTGTTSDSKDLTFVGYTPYLTAGVFMGYDQPAPMKSTNEHSKLWANIMQQIHDTKGYENKDFDRPDGIVAASVCSESGTLVSDLCLIDPRGSTARTDLFVSGTVPTEYCTVHQKVEIDTSTGMIANEFCPPDLVASISGIVRPEPYTGDEYVKDSMYEIKATNICTVHTEYDDSYVDPLTGEDTEIDEDIIIDNNTNNGTNTNGQEIINKPLYPNPLIPKTDNDASNNNSNSNNSNGTDNQGSTTEPVTPEVELPPVPEFEDNLID